MHFIFKNCFSIMKLEVEKGSDNNADICTNTFVDDTVNLSSGGFSVFETDGRSAVGVPGDDIRFS